MSDYLVGVAGPNSIGISSLKSLFDQTNISDEVIDGLIYLQCENFPHIYPIPSQITGKILDGSTRAQSAYFLKKNIFQMYEKLIGACLENGSHWTLFFCDIPKRTIVYMNSFGESEVRKSAVLKNWSSFASARGCAGEWTLSHVSHPHQQDGNSCGVHVIMVLKTIALTYISCTKGLGLCMGFPMPPECTIGVHVRNFSSETNGSQTTDSVCVHKTHLCFCFVPSISAGDRKRLNRVIRRASSVLGCPLDPVEVMSDRRTAAKLSSLMDNISHPMQQTVTALSSSFSGRLRHPRCGTERFRRSFLPTAVRLHNKDFN
ncbi:uncharacterized protein LOC111500370 isoform X2 [Maylandia zebra]